MLVHAYTMFLYIWRSIHSGHVFSIPAFFTVLRFPFPDLMGRRTNRRVGGGRGKLLK